MARKSSTPNTETPLTAEQLEKLRAAVYLAGGASQVAQRMGYRTSESIRRFTKGLKLVPAERVDAFRAAVEKRLALADIRPDLYGGLKADALGYAPKAPKAAAAQP